MQLYAPVQAICQSVPQADADVGAWAAEPVTYSVVVEFQETTGELLPTIVIPVTDMGPVDEGALPIWMFPAVAHPSVEYAYRTI
jgi:hypothetical protein